MRARSSLWIVALCLIVPSSPRVARACGGFFSDVSSKVVSMSDVRVLLIQDVNPFAPDLRAPRDGAPDGDSSRMHQYVQIGYQGEASRFAWVYPVPANPEVAEASPALLASLDEATAPRIRIRATSTGDSGCSCPIFGDDAAYAPDRLTPPAVQVWQSGQVGAFDYVVITAKVARDLLDWLQSNGFAVPQNTAPVLDHYLAMSWFFVAMKVSVQKTTAQVPATTVVRLSYPAKEIRYPLRMMSLSAAAETRLEIFVASPAAVHPVSPFAALTIKPEMVHATSRSTHNYDEVLAAVIKARPRGLVWEHVGSLSSLQVPGLDGLSPQLKINRFRTVLTPAELSTDLRFVPAEWAPPPVMEFDLNWHPEAGAAPPLPMALVGVAWLIRSALRRRRARARPTSTL